MTEVRRATAADRDAIRSLARGILPGPGLPTGEVWVACDGDARIGYLELRRVLGEAHVLAVAVEPAQRRHGVATALLEAALAGADAAFLEVRASNAEARAFYERHGFDVVGRRSRYYADGEDALLLTREAA